MCPALVSDAETNLGDDKIPFRLTSLTTRNAVQNSPVDTNGIGARRILRAKTGCLPCKSRRKKCDEKAPTCNRCSQSGRSCIWPAATDMTDRRYASHPHSRYQQNTETSLCLRSEKAGCDQTASHLEVVVSRHFIEEYYNLLLLPGCHADFRNGWLAEIQEIMVDEKSLHYSMLTNGASHIYNRDNAVEMQHLALNYYSQALRGIANALSTPKNAKALSRNGILMSVMLLYLRSCMGRDTYMDIPPHLSAAMNILKLRLFNKTAKTMQPFDRLALESVLYQIFLHSTGLWSERTPQGLYDLEYWTKAEHLLQQSVLFPDDNERANTPVLAIPASLYRLAIQAKQMIQDPQIVSSKMLSAYKSEVSGWEGMILSCKNLKQDLEQPSGDRYSEITFQLFVLVLSLLLEQLSAIFTDRENPPSDHVPLERELSPQAASQDSWQIKRAMRIIERYQSEDAWHKCYLYNWPVYTVGLFLTDPLHINIIRQDMQRRWELTKFTQIERFVPSLEITWRRRTRSPSADTT